MTAKRQGPTPGVRFIEVSLRKEKVDCTVARKYFMVILLIRYCNIMTSVGSYADTLLACYVTVPFKWFGE